MRVLTRESRATIAGLLSAIFLSVATTNTWAQTGAPSVGVSSNENVYEVVTPKSELQITEQFSRIFECPNRIIRVDGFDPDVITVSALSPNRVRVHGEKTGVTTLVITDEFDSAYSIEVFVVGDVRHLQAYLKQLFPEDDVQAVKLNDSIVLRGVVTEPQHITQIVDVALEFSTKVLNQLEVGGVHQVQLNTKVMEVQRNKMRNLGFNFLLNTKSGSFASTPGSLIPLRSSAGGTAAGFTPTVTPASLGNSAVQFAIMGASETFNGFIDALRNESLLKILAEPKLVTTSGRPATILSGGEFPILVPQGLGNTTIEYREFGVRMEAVPIVLGNGRLRLDIAPEVSERDFSNSVTVNGFVVPGITTRRVNTQVEMRFGETLMIGGLISTRRSGSTNKVPFLGELPWIGTAFRTVKYEEAETELMILVTPHMVAPLQPHQVPHMGPGQFTDTPTDRELYFDGMIEVPLYGPECNGCDATGAYGGYGSGDACINPTIPGDGYGDMVIPNDGYSLPSGEAYPAPQGMPMEGQYYESTPSYSQPPMQQELPADTGPVNFNESPKLPPLPGQAQTSAGPTSGSNAPANLGLIDPFRKRVRTGQVPIEEESHRIQVKTSQPGVGPGGQTTGLIKPRVDLAQTASTLSAPDPASTISR